MDKTSGLPMFTMIFSPIVFVAVWLTLCSPVTGIAQTKKNEVVENLLRPVITGYGVGTFKVGALLYKADFSQADDWDVQLQEKPDSRLQPRVVKTAEMLDVYAADVGCTAWLKREFVGPIAIVFRMRCPENTQHDPGITPRDANNFWMASSGDDANSSLFDRKRYTGDFRDYNQMKGYYCSSGGRSNTTTRLRRYPREADGKSVPHIALTHQDKKPEYLLTAGKWHTVQLVAYDDIVQYLFDGQLVYEIRKGDQVSVEFKRKAKKSIYNLDRFPAYTRGYFGFRMVNTHHQYKDLKVFRLEANN